MKKTKLILFLLAAAVLLSALGSFVLAGGVNFAIEPTYVEKNKWTGSPISPFTGNDTIDLGGDLTATAPGKYTATATPKAGFTWEGGGTTPKNYTWYILKEVQKPQAKSLTYNGTLQKAFEDSYEGITLTGDVSGTNASDTYAATAILDPYYTWPDGTTADATISWSIAKWKIVINDIVDQTYTGSQITPAVTVTNVPAPAYTVKYGENINAPSGTVRVETTNPNYANSDTKSFTISPKPIPSIKDIAPQNYTGQAIKPDPVFEGPVDAGSYTVSYGENTNVSTGGSVTVTAVAPNYTGTYTKNFVINPIPLPPIDDIPNQVYDWRGVEPNVTFGNNTVADTDVTIVYTNNKKVGTATVTATAKAGGNYTGEQTKNFEIVKRQLPVINSVNPASYDFSGLKNEPLVSISYWFKQLELGVDYTLSYEDNIDAGTGTVKATGMGNYGGERSKTFTIRPIDLPAATAPAPMDFTGLELEPDVTMTNPVTNTNLVKDKDYTLAYDNNINVGNDTAKITIKGKGNYKPTSTQTVFFTINPIDLPAVVAPAPMDFTGLELKPDVTMTNPVTGIRLVKDKDYTLAYKDNINAGIATITITGKGNYKTDSVKTVTFTINRILLPAIAKLPDVDFNGKEYTPDVVMKNDVTGAPLVKGTDYTLAYKNNRNAGIPAAPHAVVTVTGIGNYKESKDVTFVIKPIAMPKADAIPEQNYTGQPITPAINMKDAPTGQLVKDRDFTVAYYNHVDGAMINSTIAAKPIAVVKGINNYKGEQKIEFVIKDVNPPVFDTATARDAGGALTITVRDDWGLRKVLVLRSGAVLISEDFSANLNKQYEYEVIFREPGHYQIFAEDLYGHKVNLFNTSGDPNKTDTAGKFFVDTDKDGLSDAYERMIKTDPKNPDTDGDGLSDREEVHLGTDPKLVDTDGDGLTDSEEVDLGLDPRLFDSDFDGISDFIDSKLLEKYPARSYGSTLAMELLLRPNRSGLKPALNPQQQSAALEELATYKYLDATVNPYKAETGVNKVQFSPVDGGKRKTLQISGRDTMMVKLSLEGDQLAMLQHTLLQVGKDAKGKFRINNALMLNALTDTRGNPLFTISPEADKAKDSPVVMSDLSGNLLLIGNWSVKEQKVIDDLLLVDVSAMKAYRIPNSAGATRFDVAPGGSKVVYLLGGKVFVLDLQKTELFEYDAKASLLGFTQEDELLIGVKGGKAVKLNLEDDGKESLVEFEGILFLKQPTNNHINAVLVQDGVEMPFGFTAVVSLSATGRASQRAVPARKDAELMQPAFNNVRLFDRVKNILVFNKKDLIP